MIDYATVFTVVVICMTWAYCMYTLSNMFKVYTRPQQQVYDSRPRTRPQFDDFGNPWPSNQLPDDYDEETHIRSFYLTHPPELPQ